MGVWVRVGGCEWVGGSGGWGVPKYQPLVSDSKHFYPKEGV